MANRLKLIHRTTMLTIGAKSSIFIFRKPFRWQKFITQTTILWVGKIVSMFGWVIFTAKDLKIFRRIIEFVSIFMVDTLLSGQSPPKKAFHNNPMCTPISTVLMANMVTLFVYIATFRRYIYHVLSIIYPMANCKNE